ncbi:diacylglycerol/lipid kinase family protein [Flagellimonas abyssi]|uniref:Diacylglycerol kinase family lipid kinase n=1 Tax=Flagellimonas abyssi TaxID=2864871 RepID=A0ABS7EY98_9FLAO|nr:diacylglycerol kinase family protein [Allomuricauda abyssi]MBW8201979.1 diacylglycerol kinase family lipid kinase [Allomuricauda abyssi]
MKNVHFIVNPIAGKGDSTINEVLLSQYFEAKHFDLCLKISNYPGHATELTKASLHEGAHIIVACGGDGTINEVASCLVGTNIPLGIIPFGSGNGLASNLDIPKNLCEALGLLRNAHMTKIDVGRMNGRFFFSNTGVGFDASVIKNYESSNRRTLSGYLAACITSLKQLTKPQEIEIKANGRKWKTTPFLVFVSNTNVMGYHLSLTPQASLQDGLLDVLVVTKVNRVKMLVLGVLLLMNRPHLLKEARHFQTTTLALSTLPGTHFDSQIDGEFHAVEDNTIFIGIEKKALTVIVPEQL